MEIQQRQTQAYAALMEAHRHQNDGKLSEADQAFTETIRLIRDAIDLTTVYNQNAQTAFDLAPMAQILVNSLSIQADNGESRGDITRAELLRKEVLELSHRYLGATANAESERARADSLILQGRFNEALVALASARDQFQADGDIVKVIRTSLNIVNILHWLNDNQRAAKELSRAASASSLFLENATGQTGSTTWAQSLQQLQNVAELSYIQTQLDYYQGLVQKDLGNLEVAEQSFRKVLPQYESIGGGAGIEFHLAVIQLKKGDYNGSWSLLQQITPEVESSPIFRSRLAALLKVQADVLFKLGRTHDAHITVNRAITDLSNYKDPDQLWKCYALRSELLAALRREDEAVESYRQTATVINSLRLHSLGYRLDSTFLQDKLPILEAAIDLCAARRRAKECASFVEMLKSRSLLTLLSAPSCAESDSGAQEKQFAEVTQKLDALEYSQFSEGVSPETEEQKEALLSQRAQLLERLRYSDPRWRSMSQPPATDWNKISRLLAKRKQAALTLYYRPGKIVAVLLQDGSFTAGTIELSPETLELLQANAANLHSSNPDCTRYDVSASMGLGAKHLVPPQLLEMGLKGSGLIIIPHGPLHLLPWAGLIFNGKRLFEYCPIGILPNVGCIAALSSKFSAQPALAVIGAPDYGGMRFLPSLPSAEREIHDLTALYMDQIIETSFIGKAATRLNFWKLLSNPRPEAILHAACHATFEPLEPMRSGLLLTDSKVDAAEIARQRIFFHEVVLSACSTGYRPTEVEGIPLAGDDILGLPGAFLEAGAAAVLVSIPTADDQASAALVVQYHQHRRSGCTPLVALQKAQLAMLDTAFEPFQWIGFTAYSAQ
jgi:CHAT domain-containing protein